MFAFCFKKAMAARKISEQQIQEIISEFEKTCSIAIAAKSAGVSETTASTYLVSFGYHKRKAHVNAPEGMKYCRRCSQTLSQTEFSARGKSKDAWCKSCNNARNKPHSLKHSLKRLGVDSEAYYFLMQAQQDCCAICGEKEGHKSKTGCIARLSLDHDHKTGDLRGLLCNRCNRGLGYLSDSVELVSNALHYLLEAERKR